MGAQKGVNVKQGLEGVQMGSKRGPLGGPEGSQLGIHVLYHIKHPFGIHTQTRLRDFQK